MQNIKKILNWYANENNGVKTSLAILLNQGILAGTGKLVILPVDQGFEHGPDRSFASYPAGYDPNYHMNLAIKAGLSAFAAPLGMLESCIPQHYGQIPLILKLNSNNSLLSDELQPYPALTSSVEDALRLGCVGVGLTIYPGSNKFREMLLEAKEIIRQAKSYGLFVVIWSYPRGGGVSKAGQTALDVCAYAAHIACLIGANIVKVKLPTSYIEKKENKQIYELHNKELLPNSTSPEESISLEHRIQHIMKSAFNGTRLVVFSGGPSKSDEELLNEVRCINKAGGNGSIIGRNSFQKQQDKALSLLSEICNIYGGLNVQMQHFCRN